jgi:hypothetical protein
VRNAEDVGDVVHKLRVRIAPEEHDVADHGERPCAGSAYRRYEVEVVWATEIEDRGTTATGELNKDGSRPEWRETRGSARTGKRGDGSSDVRLVLSSDKKLSSKSSDFRRHSCSFRSSLSAPRDLGVRFAGGRGGIPG